MLGARYSIPGRMLWLRSIQSTFLEHPFAILGIYGLRFTTSRHFFASIPFARLQSSFHDINSSSRRVNRHFAPSLGFAQHQFDISGSQISFAPLQSTFRNSKSSMRYLNSSSHQNNRHFLISNRLRAVSFHSALLSTDISLL